MNLLELNHVKKNFGQQEVLKDINLTVPAGSIYGFVGKNGSGKTTTMKLILGLEKLSAGTITIQGETVTFGKTPTNRFTGYLPDVPEFYPYMTAFEYLKLCGEIANFSKQEIQEKIPTLLEKVGLKNSRQKIKGFSRGMKQRLGIAQALLTEPELLICDEPTSALDPSGRQEFLDLLGSLRGKTTILFSTHILTDVERICDHVAILHEGRIVSAAPLEELQKKYATPNIQLKVVSGDRQKLPSFLKKLQEKEVLTAFTLTAETAHLHYTLPTEKVMKILLETLLKEQLTPVLLEEVTPTLEQVFLEVTKA